MIKLMQAMEKRRIAETHDGEEDELEDANDERNVRELFEIATLTGYIEKIAARLKIAL